MFLKNKKMVIKRMIFVLAFTLLLTGCTSMFDSVVSTTECEHELETDCEHEQADEPEITGHYERILEMPIVAGEPMRHRARVVIITEDVSDVLSVLEYLIEKYQGTVISFNTREIHDSYKDGGRPHFMTHIPIEYYQNMLLQLREIEVIDYLSLDTVNTAAEFAEFRSKRDVLLLQVEQFQALREATEEMHDLILLETQIGETLLEIEIVEREIRRIEASVDYATIEVGIRRPRSTGFFDWYMWK
ncbi:MAG: DUF4349 domain-containing protein [Lachnospiraceae bacterium]|nr:DUF4349 domain-containing protein [Lachnospiraceae bacterium]